MKKVLAWAVALALVLSSFTMAFAADTKTSADFKDASQIQYTEAVDVMVATGIINGYPDGTFGPTKTVKRSEMAKMIAVMMNGGEDVGDQFKSACPFADSKDHWAAGYIAYCASEHIIDGRSADVFDPEAEVTGTEVAKMALTSLGYDSKIQGYTGENWAAAVLKDAKKAKLFKGLADDFVPGDPCTREAAAQILFNCLKGTMVEYDNGTSVSVGDDVNVVVSSKIKNVPSDEDVEDGNKEDMQLYENAFDGKVKLSDKGESGNDDFGRPAHQWTQKDGKNTDEIGTYADSADYEFVAEKVDIKEAVKAYDEDLFDDIEKYEFTTRVNGGQGSIGVGDKVELYVDKDEETVLAIVAQYQADRITGVDTDVSSADAKKDITAYVSFEGLGDKNDVDITGYDASAYVEDAIIAVALNSKGEIIDSYAMDELASGEVTKTFGTTAVTIDGTKYEAATNAKPFDYTGNMAVESSYTLYDYNGYYLASVLDEAKDDTLYGVLEVYGSDSDIFGNTSASVKIINAEGKEEVLAVDTEKVKAEGLPTLDKDDTDDVLVAYTLNDDGEVNKITKATESFAAKAKMKTNGVIGGKSVSEDVVVFYNNGEVKDPEYVTYGFADLEAADEVAGDYITNADGDIIAVMLSKSLEADETILGFVTDVESYETSDGYQADVTALVDGKEVSYTTVAAESAPAIQKSTSLVEFVLNKDGELKEVVAVEPRPANEIQENFADGVKAYFLSGIVNDKKNNSLNLGTDESKNYQAVNDAYVYFINADGDMEISSYAKIKTKNEVTLYQTDADSSAWNIVVFKEVPQVAPADGGVN